MPGNLDFIELPNQDMGDKDLRNAFSGLSGELRWGGLILESIKLDDRTYAIKEKPSAEWEHISKSEGISLAVMTGIPAERKRRPKVR